MVNSRGNYGPLTLAELDYGGNVWVAWVKKLSLQRFVAKTALSPDKQLLLSVAGCAQRWGVSPAYVYQLIQQERLEATVLEDTYGHKVGFGVSYGEVLRYEKDAKKRGFLKKMRIGEILTPE